MTGRTQPGAVPWTVLLDAVAAAEPHNAALEPDEPSALSAIHGLSAAV
jgi:hypothetical protein